MIELDHEQQAARDWFESLRDRICAEFESIEREADRLKRSMIKTNSFVPSEVEARRCGRPSTALGTNGKWL